MILRSLHISALLLASGLGLAGSAAAELPPEGAPGSMATAPATPKAAAEADLLPFRPVTLAANWGPLPARFRPSPKGKSPAVLIIGASGRSLEGMDPLARRLQALGYTVLSVQNPAGIIRKDGMGIPILDRRRISMDGIPDLVRDLHAALRFLKDAPEASPGPLAVVGEGLGVSLAAHLGAESDRVAVVAYVVPAKECDPFATRAALEKASERKPSLLITGIKDQTYRAWFEQALPNTAGLTLLDPLTRPGGAEEEQGAWASHEIPFPQDVAAWLVTCFPLGKN